MAVGFSEHETDRHWTNKWMKFMHIKENGNEARIRKRQ